MRAHEAFNRSAFSQLVNSAGGRGFRIAAGLTFLAVGLTHRRRRAGIAAIAWSFFPLSAGLLDLCWISLALGGPASGATIRALGTGVDERRPDARALTRRWRGVSAASPSPARPTTS